MRWKLCFSNNLIKQVFVNSYLIAKTNPIECNLNRLHIDINKHYSLKDSKLKTLYQMFSIVI